MTGNHTFRRNHPRHRFRGNRVRREKLRKNRSENPFRMLTSSVVRAENLRQPFDIPVGNRHNQTRFHLLKWAQSCSLEMSRRDGIGRFHVHDAATSQQTERTQSHVEHIAIMPAARFAKPVGNG